MTRNFVGHGRSLSRPRQAGGSSAPLLTLRQPAPNEWRYYNPSAYAGDPEMDWESRPEPPKEPRYVFAEVNPAAKRH